MAVKPAQSSRVFLCYAQNDYDIVYTLYTRLLHDNVSVYLDEESVLPGQDWDLEISNTIRNADIIIICLTKEFSQAGYHLKEMRLALDEADMQPDGRIYIIPARLENCDIVEGLNRWQVVDLFRPTGYEKLKRTIEVQTINLSVELEKNESPSVTSAKKSLVNQNLISKRKGEEKWTKNNKLSVSKKLSKNNHIKSRNKKPLKTEIVVALIGAFAYVIAGLLGSPISEKIFSDNVVPSITHTPAVYQEAANPPETYPTEIADVDLAGNIIFMKLVPTGRFMMGSDYGINDGNFIHSIFTDAFYIDVKEVTN